MKSRFLLCRASTVLGILEEEIVFKMSTLWTADGFGTGVGEIVELLG